LENQDLKNAKIIGRILTFSDGIFAIAILLLLIDIKLPPDTSNANLGSALLSLWPNYLSFFISFVVIGLYWSAHLRLFREILRYDWFLVWLNLFYLMFIVIIPFSTTIISTNFSNLSVIIYAVTIASAGYMNTIVRVYSTTNFRLISDEVGKAYIKKGILMSLISPIGFTASIGVAFINPTAAQFFWIAVLVAHLILQRLVKTQS
jgi:uncharacterized membrane protein